MTSPLPSPPVGANQQDTETQPHGTAVRYNSRSRPCRCDECKKAWADYQRAYRAAKKVQRQTEVGPGETWHGTSAGYAHAGHGCRCEYCSAYHRVSNRRSSTPELLKEIAAAALVGAPLPEMARVYGVKGGPVAGVRRLSAEEFNAARGSALSAADDAHQARLRAVTKANRSIAALALLSVAEYTEDPVRAMRYERIGLELAKGDA